MSAESFMDLMARVRAGDREAGEEFRRRYFPRLLGLVRRRLWGGIREEKDLSVVGSILDSLEAHVACADLRGEGDESLWDQFARIALRHCSKHNKRAQRKQERMGPVARIGHGADGKSGPGFEPEDDGPPPGAALEYADFLESFQSKLTPRQQQILQWELDDWPRKKMADELNVAVVTVDRELKAIRHRLRNEWDVADKD